MSEQADKLNAIIADLWATEHLKSMDTSQPFEPWWSQGAQAEILDWAINDPDFIKPFFNDGILSGQLAIEAALALVTDDDPMKGCDTYQEIKAEHDRYLPKDTAGLERG